MQWQQLAPPHTPQARPDTSNPPDPSPPKMVLILELAAVALAADLARRGVMAIARIASTAPSRTISLDLNALPEPGQTAASYYAALAARGPQSVAGDTNCHSQAAGASPACGPRRPRRGFHPITVLAPL